MLLLLTQGGGTARAIDVTHGLNDVAFFLKWPFPALILVENVVGSQVYCYERKCQGCSHSKLEQYSESPQAREGFLKM